MWCDGAIHSSISGVNTEIITPVVDQHSNPLTCSYLLFADKYNFLAAFLSLLLFIAAILFIPLTAHLAKPIVQGWHVSDHPVVGRKSLNSLVPMPHLWLSCGMGTRPA